jgi:hypothetical protein
MIGGDAAEVSLAIDDAVGSHLIVHGVVLSHTAVGAQWSGGDGALLKLRLPTGIDADRATALCAAPLIIAAVRRVNAGEGASCEFIGFGSAVGFVPLHCTSADNGTDSACGDPSAFSARAVQVLPPAASDSGTADGVIAVFESLHALLMASNGGADTFMDALARELAALA